MSFARTWNALIRAGTPVYGVYCDYETPDWVTGRLQRVRQRCARGALLHEAWPWDGTEWRELLTWRHVWRETSPPRTKTLTGEEYRNENC